MSKLKRRSSIEIGIFVLVFTLQAGSPTFGSEEHLIDLDLPLTANPWTLQVTDIEKDSANIIASFSDGKFTVWSSNNLSNPSYTVKPNLNIQMPYRARAIDISNNGEVIAYSDPGNSDNAENAKILFYDAVTRERLLGAGEIDIPAPAQVLEFSADGKLLAAGFGENKGVMLWEWRSKKLIWEGGFVFGAITSLSFGSQQGVLVVAGDFGIKILQVTNINSISLVQEKSWRDLPIKFSKDEFIPIDENCTKTLGKITSVSLSPDGTKIAIGTRVRVKGYGVVYVLNVSDLSLAVKYKVKLERQWKQFLSQVSWSNNGKYLFAAGRFWNSTREPTRFSYLESGLQYTSGIVRWDAFAPANKPVILKTIGSQTIVSIKPYDQNGVAYISSDPVLGIYNFNELGELSHEDNTYGLGFDFRGNFKSRFMAREFAINEQGTIVTIESLKERIGFTFDFNTMTLVSKKPIDGDRLIRRKHNRGIVKNWYLADQWKEKLLIFNQDLDKYVSVSSEGKSCLVSARETSRTYTMLRNGKIIWGTSHYLHLLNGHKIETLKRISSDAWRVLVNEQETIAVVAHIDGTIRWYDISDNFELLATLFVDRNYDWIAWTPQGYYATNSNPNSVKVFRQNPFRNEVVRISLEKDRAILNNHEAILETIHTRKMLEGRDQRTIKLGPQIELTNVEVIGKSKLKARYRLSKTSDEEQTRLEFNFSCSASDVSVVQEKTSLGQKETIISIPSDCKLKKSVTLNAIATDQSGESRGAINVRLTPERKNIINTRKHYAVIVGNDFDSESYPGYKLDFAVSDASSFAELLCAQRGLLWSEVKIYTIGFVPNLDCVHSNSSASISQSEIEKGLYWLGMEAELLAEDDAVTLYFAGHGHQSKNNYFYWTGDTNPESQASLDLTSLSNLDIVKHFNHLGEHTPRLFVFLDTCRVDTNFTNGYRVITSWQNYNMRADFLVATGEGNESNALAYEDPELQSGVFTYYMLEGLKGEADRFKVNGEVSLYELANYVKENVFKRTNESQRPVWGISGKSETYALGVRH